MNLALLLLATAGHAFLWIGLVNRLHAVDIPRKLLKRTTAVLFLCATAIPVAVGWWYAANFGWPTVDSWRGPADETIAGFLVTTYVVLCWAIAPMTVVRLAWIRFLHRRPAIVRFHGTRQVAINLTAAAMTAADHSHHPLTRLAWNEVLQFEVNQWAIDVPGLPPALDGLSIVQISDSHFTGRIGKAFFHEVVRVTNELQPDLICITGDIMDDADCYGWIADTLGQLKAGHGVYFILGNHDRRVDFARVRREMEQCGLVNLGGRSCTVEIRGVPVELAGNECPWFKPMPEFPSPIKGGLRIALAHSPDQLDWARKNDVDLLLAGHTHGGQIRIPPLGAIFSPSVGGVKYIAGIFYAPPTILQVSRGISGDVPVRWNCRPEITLLQLRAEKCH
jgi:predicted MPP superfamily phosphohydrolase